METFVHGLLLHLRQGELVSLSQTARHHAKSCGLTGSDVLGITLIYFHMSFQEICDACDSSHHCAVLCLGPNGKQICKCAPCYHMALSSHSVGVNSVTAAANSPALKHAASVCEAK